MKSLYGLGLSTLLFAGLAAAAPDPLSQVDINQTVTTSPAAVNSTSTVNLSNPDGYVFNVREQGGHDGTLTFGENEITFEANHEKHSMAWNYNVIKKLKMNSSRNVMYLVLHGGESIRFKVIGGQMPSDVLVHVVATRIAKAPRYHSSI
jgi:hypothetical protein